MCSPGNSHLYVHIDLVFASCLSDGVVFFGAFDTDEGSFIEKTSYSGCSATGKGVEYGSTFWAEYLNEVRE